MVTISFTTDDTTPETVAAAVDIIDGILGMAASQSVLRSTYEDGEGTFTIEMDHAEADTAADELNYVTGLVASILPFMVDNVQVTRQAPATV